MADITVTFTDADQQSIQQEADYTKASVDYAELHKPSIYWTPVHNHLNTIACMLEDKLGYARGTLYGSSSSTTVTPQSGGTDKT